MLEFPDNIGELVGEGSIVVSVQTKGGGRVRFQEKRLELYPLDLKMKDAEDFCVSRGGHLASIGSQEDLDEIAEVAGGEFVSSVRSSSGYHGLIEIQQQQATFPNFQIWSNPAYIHS